MRRLLGFCVFGIHCRYALILRAVSRSAQCSEWSTVVMELCAVSKNMRCDWILKASALTLERSAPYPS